MNNTTNTQLPRACARPCNDCPWRRVATPGWLGPHTADQWVQLAHTDEPIACHETIVEDDDWTTPGLRQCKGAAIYRKNIAKLPRNPEVAVADEADRDNVFASPAEFTTHHARKQDPK